MGLNVVEKEYLKLLKPHLSDAIKNGEPDLAASFAKELARLHRKKRGSRKGRIGCTV